MLRDFAAIFPFGQQRGQSGHQGRGWLRWTVGCHCPSAAFPGRPQAICGGGEELWTVSAASVRENRYFCAFSTVIIIFYSMYFFQNSALKSKI
jgi:hypothetical protein